MSQIVEAVFERGVFRVIDATGLALSEGQQVRLVVDADSKSPEEMLDLAARVYDGLSGEEIRAVEKVALDRKDFFGDGPQS